MHIYTAAEDLLMTLLQSKHMEESEWWIFCRSLKMRGLQVYPSVSMQIEYVGTCESKEEMLMENLHMTVHLQVCL